jgi:ribosome-associated protein
LLYNWEWRSDVCRNLGENSEPVLIKKYKEKGIFSIMCSSARWGENGFMKIPAISINPDEIHLDFIRASGPGGQNVNKVATAVQLRFDARNSRSLTPDVRDRLLRLAGKRVNSSGEIIIEARRYRTQQSNREDAIRRLMQLIEKAGIPPKIRRKSKPTAASKQKRYDEKKRRSGIKKLRIRAFEE